MCIRDRALLGAERHAAREEALEEVAAGEAQGVGVGDRLVGGQALGKAVAEKAPQIEAQGGEAQQLAHRAAAFEGPGQHQLEQHDRVERGAADLAGVERRRRLAHEAPVDELIEAPVEIVLADQLVEADHLDLEGFPLASLGAHRHAASSSLAYCSSTCLLYTSPSPRDRTR